MIKGNFAVLATMLLSLASIAAASAEDQRYISIRNTDSVWVPGCLGAWWHMRTAVPTGQWRRRSGGQETGRNYAGQR